MPKRAFFAPPPHLWGLPPKCIKSAILSLLPVNLPSSYPAFIPTRPPLPGSHSP
jgi:hypothetical protein